MSPALGRLKRAAVLAVQLNGGKEGAAATVGKSPALAGSWRNINEAALPTLGDALALDEVALTQGKAPPLLTALAAELGHVAILLPSFGGDVDAESSALMEAVQEVGDVSGAIRDMLADGVRQQHERDRVVHEIDEAMAKFARLRAIVAGPVKIAVAEREARG